MKPSYSELSIQISRKLMNDYKNKKISHTDFIVFNRTITGILDRLYVKEYNDGMNNKNDRFC